MTAAALRVVEATTLDELAAHAAVWDALASNASRHGLLAATYPWYSAFVEHRGSEVGRSWICLFAYAGDDLVGVLPCIRRPHKLLRNLRPWLQVPGDVYTTGGDVLLAEERAAEVLPALLEAARRTRPRPIGVRLGGLVPTSLALQQLGGTGAYLVPEELAGRSVELQGTWESFHAGLGSNMRRNLRKSRNRLGREGAVEVESGVEPELLERFLELEAAGWKGADGGAVARHADVLGFYRAFCERLAERGWLQWHFLTLDGQTIAASMAIRWGTQIVLQRVAYDERHARTSPGQLLLAEALEGWFSEERFERVDCLTDQPWHATWRMEHSPYAAALVARGLAGTLAGDLPARARTRLKGFGPLRRLVRRIRGGA